jgi:hypothetical protein
MEPVELYYSFYYNTFWLLVRVCKAVKKNKPRFLQAIKFLGIILYNHSHYIIVIHAA